MQALLETSESVLNNQLPIVFSEVFNGNVEQIEANKVSGWANLKDDETKRVQITLVHEGTDIAKTQASRFRQDLVDAGIGDGCYSFSISLPAQLLSLSTEAVLDIDVVASEHESSDRYLIQTVKVPIPGHNALNARNSSLLLDTVSRFTEQANDNLHNEKRHSAPRVKRYEESCEESPVSKLFNKVGDIESENAAPKNKPSEWEMSPYLVYMRDRFNLTRQFPVERVPNARAEFLLWYLQHYSAIRNPYRIPLGSHEIAYANEILTFPHCKFGISRLHYFTLIGENSTLPMNLMLNSVDQYQAQVFHWVNYKCRDMGCQDVLVPDEYRRFLRSCSARWQGKPHPLSRYVETLFNQTPEWHTFDMDVDHHRLCVNLLVILGTLRNPSNFDHIHDAVFDSFTKDKAAAFLSLLRDTAQSYQDHEISEIVANLDLEVTLHHVLLQLGYNTRNRQHLTIDRSGNRYEGAALRAQETDTTCDVQVIGPANKASGLGQATRMSIAMLQKTGLKLNVVDFDMDNPAPVGFNDDIATQKIRRSKINLIHLNAESIPLAVAYLPDVFTDSYNIGYFFWELDTPARCHTLALSLLDEVWVSTEYGVQQYEGEKNPIVTNVGMTYEALEIPDKEICRQMLESDFGIDAEETVFLTSFDSFSFIQRKNPAAVVRAFQQAFSESESVKLLIKTQNRDSVTDPEQVQLWQELDALISHDERVILINRTMKYKDVLKLKRGSDCYVSLHRSEGWGFGMIEAMGLGVPVIATNYSGNTDFCHEDTCWLVDAPEVYLSSQDYIFVEAGQKWGEPDIAMAANCFTEAYSNPESRTQKSLNASIYIENNFGFNAIFSRYEKRVQQLLADIED